MFSVLLGMNSDVRDSFLFEAEMSTEVFATQERDQRFPDSPKTIQVCGRLARTAMSYKVPDITSTEEHSFAETSTFSV